MLRSAVSAGCAATAQGTSTAVVGQWANREWPVKPPGASGLKPAAPCEPPAAEQGLGQGHHTGAGVVVGSEWDCCRDHGTCAENRETERKGENTIWTRVVLPEHRIQPLLPALADTLPKFPVAGILGWQGPEGHFYTADIVCNSDWPWGAASGP